MTQEEPLTGEEYKEYLEKQTCENCGHLERFHNKMRNQCWDKGNTKGYGCECKKFQAKTSLDKKPKGCGKEFTYEADGDNYICGEEFEYDSGEESDSGCGYLLCPSCKTKNHSPNCPYTGKKGYVEEEDCHCFCCGVHKPKEGTSLSDMIFFGHINEISEGIKSKATFGAQIIEKKDVKEFIRKVEEDIKDGRRKPVERYGICDYCEARFKEIIKKRAGEELI